MTGTLFYRLPWYIRILPLQARMAWVRRQIAKRQHAI